MHACMPLDTILRKHYKSPGPALNVMKHNELVYMNATWSDAPTIDHGVTNDHNLIVTALFCLEHQSAVSMINLAIQAAAPPTVILAFVAMGSLILALILSVSMVWIQLPSLAFPFQHA